MCVTNNYAEELNIQELLFKKVFHPRGQALALVTSVSLIHWQDIVCVCVCVLFEKIFCQFSYRTLSYVGWFAAMY